MYKRIILLSFFGFIAACSGKPERTVCLHTNVEMTAAALKETNALDAIQEKKVAGCGAYFNKQPVKNSSSSMQALLERVKANTLLENYVSAQADMATLKALLATTRKESHPDFQRGAGLTIAVVNAMNSEDPLAVLRPLVKNHPYLEPLHQIAFSYAVEQGEYLAALEYLYLSERLPSGEGLVRTKGYLLKMAGLTNAAMRQYEKTMPTAENRIRLAHLYLAQGEKEKSLIAFAEARTLAVMPVETYTADEKLLAVADRYQGNENLLSYDLDKRLAVLETLHRGGPDTYEKLAKLGREFPHYELTAALKLARAQAAHVGSAPRLITVALKGPQPLPFSLVERAADIRKVALNNMPDFIPGAAFAPSVSNYSTSVWLLKPNGYSHKRQKNGTMEVSFMGSAVTGRARLAEMALLRASQLAQENAKPYFTIRSIDHFSRIRTYDGAPISAPVAFKVTTVVKFHDRMPEDGKAFKARDVYRELGPLYLPIRTVAR